MKGKIPTLEEFNRLRELLLGGWRFTRVMRENGYARGEDFYDWWNYQTEEGEVEAFLKRYSKLGKLLAGVDDV